MAKGYWIVHVDVVDPEAYEQYRSANGAPIAQFGGRFLIRGGPSEIPEGASRARHVVIEFPSYQAARDCYANPAYQAAKALRTDSADSDIIIIEGYDGVQPGGK